ncbi:hypothetical protein K431DRAFT_291727 [Polychaeton citri CBS 116435]|uniref:Transcriptional regulator n=1 Tax=Polychaeton citri CBS 116435 TaxID=1314669 RepID=A0A9P4QGB9_9PEZI|nr:hypothetical protein K431DRAFT_291727 [Polychaeton citri CBS 116435]
MSDSDASERSARSMSDEQIERCLGEIVRDALKNDEEVTINSARSKAEAKLDLEEGFLRNAAWKQRSKDIISAVVENPESPKALEKAPTKATPKTGSKRKLQGATSKNKRRKKVASESEESEAEALVESDEGDTEPQPTRRQSRSKKTATSEDQPDNEATVPAHGNGQAGDQGSDDESSLSEPPKTSAEPETKAAAGDAAANDSSDFSSVIDEPIPQKKKKRQKKSPSTSVTPKPATKRSAKGKTASAKEVSPDDEEIKRLQGWLLKCGIRKVWGKELKRFDTSREKVGHLKSLLDDVGMTGRYSQEKARQIKESRELAAELAEAKAFNETWGHNEDAESDASDGEKPRRRLKPRGLVDLGDFGEGGDNDSE